MTHRVGIVTILVFVLAACTPVAAETPIVLLTDTASNVPATQPSPSGTASASPTPEPSATPQPPPDETPTLFPSPDYSLTSTAAVLFTPEPTSAAAIQIQEPGPLSKVVSPIKLRGYVIPGAFHRVRVELFGEDGRLLVRQILAVYNVTKWGYLSVDIPFEVHAAGELGRLTIDTLDQYGRIRALASVHLLLLSEGSYGINLPGNLDEHCILKFPQPDSYIAGGTLIVDGEMRPFNNQPLVIELVGNDGVVVGARLIEAQPAANDNYVPFTVDVPYIISIPTSVRLTIRQADDKISGTMYLFSQEVLLNP